MKRFLFIVLILLLFVPSCEKKDQKVLVFDSADVSVWVRVNDEVDSLLAMQAGLVLNACLKDPEIRMAFSELLQLFALARLKQLEETLNLHETEDTTAGGKL